MTVPERVLFIYLFFGCSDRIPQAAYPPSIWWDPSNNGSHYQSLSLSMVKIHSFTASWACDRLPNPLPNKKTLNLDTLLSFSYPRHFTGEVYSKYTVTHTWCSLWFRTPSLSCQARRVIYCATSLFSWFSFRIKCNSAFVGSMGRKKKNTKIFNAVSVHNKHPSTGHSDTDREALSNVTSNSDYQLIISEDNKCQTYCCRSFSIGRLSLFAVSAGENTISEDYTFGSPGSTDDVSHCWSCP